MELNLPGSQLLQDFELGFDCARPSGQSWHDILLSTELILPGGQTCGSIYMMEFKKNRI